MTPAPRTPSASAQSQLFHEAVQRTLASKSFTIHSLGPLLYYQAQNRTRVVMVPGTTPSNPGISIVTIGSNGYAILAGIWVTEPKSKGYATGLFPGRRDLALEYLEPLTQFRAAKLNGNIFTVREITSKLPLALQTLIFTAVETVPNGLETSSSLPPAGRLNVTGYITVQNGFVVSEVFRAEGLHAHSRKSRAHMRKGE